MTQRFKAHAALTSALLSACDALAHKRPPCDPVTGKALDPIAFKAWRDECVALAVHETRPMRAGRLIASSRK